jgi:hypothetical protein
MMSETLFCSISELFGPGRVDIEYDICRIVGTNSPCHHIGECSQLNAVPATLVLASANVN